MGCVADEQPYRLTASKRSSFGTRQPMQSDPLSVMQMTALCRKRAGRAELDSKGKYPKGLDAPTPSTYRAALRDRNATLLFIGI
jgi:hypothetical protein